MQSRQPLTTSRKSPGSDRDMGKVGLTTGVKLRSPEGAERPRASSASMAELAGAHLHVPPAAENDCVPSACGSLIRGATAH
jgi:hypothetical protein